MLMISSDMSDQAQAETGTDDPGPMQCERFPDPVLVYDVYDVGGFSSSYDVTPLQNLVEQQHQ